MRKIDMRIDVTTTMDFGGSSHIAATVFLPDASKLSDPPVVMFASPGGGYGRAYYDIYHPGVEHYSQAEHHTREGFVFIAYDHLGVGDSSLERLEDLTVESIALANDHAVRALSARLERGTLASELRPLPGLVRIGLGHSMGACLTIIMQARHRTFDAIVPMGFSAIHTIMPHAPGNSSGPSADPDSWSPEDFGRHLDEIVYAFFWADVPSALVRADMKGGYPLRQTTPPWGSLTVPPCIQAILAPGVIRQEAAEIDVPVLVAVGERDVCPEPRAEPSAFERTTDVSLFIVPQMAHMHNFASTRRALWDRVGEWSWMIARQLAGRGA